MHSHTDDYHIDKVTFRRRGTGEIELKAGSTEIVMGPEEALDMLHDLADLLAKMALVSTEIAGPDAAPEPKVVEEASQ